MNMNASSTNPSLCKGLPNYVVMSIRHRLKTQVISTYPLQAHGVSPPWLLNTIPVSLERLVPIRVVLALVRLRNKDDHARGYGSEPYA